MSNKLETELRSIGLYGVANSLGTFAEDLAVLERIVDCETSSRRERLIARRLAFARLGTFRSMSEFDWGWPKKIPRSSVEDALELRFMEDKGSVILIGANGVGKTMIAKNIAMRAVLLGHSVYFSNAGKMLNELSKCEDARSLERKLSQLEKFNLVVIDELGYMSYGTRHADLLFQFIERRHEKHSLVLTTNKTFSEWNTIFPNAACVSAMVDRLVQYGDIISIDAESFRLHQGMERQRKKKTQEQAKKKSVVN